ncbi:MAG: hypothetical protein JO235_08945 [Chroococcidiopsidaceae cyanobacterium CP_BM_RX_35]|nr:hypothetical protein [Chroococcidiopsidaceae cyanobacterium CP_BM_RX_35]
MQENSHQVGTELQEAVALDAWIDAQLQGREAISNLPDLDPDVVGMTALAHDLMSLGEAVQPAEDFVMHLSAHLEGAALNARLGQQSKYFP